MAATAGAEVDGGVPAVRHGMGVGPRPAPADDRGVGKFGYLALACALALPAVVYALDWGGLEFALPGPAGTPPAALTTLGTPAPPPAVPVDVAALFRSPGEGSDPWSPAVWAPAAELLAGGGTPSGWTALCQAFAAAAGSDRAAAPLPGALACSGDASLLPLQRVAALVLEAKAQLLLWLRNAPGASATAVSARQAAIRLACAALPDAKTPGSPIASACTAALDTAYLAGDTAGTLAQLEAAYRSLAEAIASRDPTVAPEPSFPGEGTTP